MPTCNMFMCITYYCATGYSVTCNIAACAYHKHRHKRLDNLAAGRTSLISHSSHGMRHKTEYSPLPPPTRRRSRSRSPARYSPYQAQKSPPRFRQRSPAPRGGHIRNKGASFQAGTSSTPLSACAICLGRHRHDVYKCSADALWDASKARCRRNDNGRLVNPNGITICSDWQRIAGCASTAHDSRHECSGCGKSDHGAQTCPRGQKE